MSVSLTVFTPTYNRAYILPELYKSLCTQTSYDFEWIIIDDESKDETESLVNRWILEEKRFRIRYFKQVHGGKHRALNKGFDQAEGEFFFIVDSDDRLTKDAVEVINKWTSDIADKQIYAGVSGLRVSNNNTIWGGIPKMNSKYIDANNFDRGKYGLLGDKAEVYRTSILRRYKFPEFDNEFFVTEDYCWLNIAASGYILRWYNYPIYICEYLEDGLTKSGANSIEGHINNYKGYCAYTKECLNKKPYIQKMMHFRDFCKTMNYINKKTKDAAYDLSIPIYKYRFYKYIASPVATLMRKLGKK